MPFFAVLQGELVVGATLPATVVLMPVSTRVYVTTRGVAAVTQSYAFVNGKRVVGWSSTTRGVSWW